MKAEHRKELQTNTLADFLGRTVRKVTSTSGIPWFRIVLVVAIVGGVFMFFWRKSNSSRANSDLLVKFDARTQQSLKILFSEDLKETKQAKLVRYQFIYQNLWAGIKALGSEATFSEGEKMIGLSIAYYE